MGKELVYSTRIIDAVEIYVDDDVVEDEIEIDYFFPKRTYRYTVKMKAVDLFPELFSTPSTSAEEQ